MCIIYIYIHTYIHTVSRALRRAISKSFGFLEVPNYHACSEHTGDVGCSTMLVPSLSVRELGFRQPYTCRARHAHASHLHLRALDCRIGQIICTFEPLTTTTTTTTTTTPTIIMMIIINKQISIFISKYKYRNVCVYIYIYIYTYFPSTPSVERRSCAFFVRRLRYLRKGATGPRLPVTSISLVRKRNKRSSFSESWQCMDLGFARQRFYAATSRRLIKPSHGMQVIIIIICTHTIV